MKYFIYWLFYSSNIGGGNIAGTVEVTDTTVSSYVYDVGYFTWNITEKHEAIDKERKFVHSAEYHLERDSVKSVMIIGPRGIAHYIASDPPIRITMKRKK